MLAGAAGLAVPIALHLIAKHKFPIRDFPTLRLLMKDEQTNVFAPRLIDPWQLLLRLLVLLLLVFTMSRMFAPGFTNAPAPRNLVVVMDCSASMRMTVKDPAGDGEVPLIDLARRKARELLRDLAPPGQAALVAAAGETHVLSELQPGSAAALAALDSGTAATDGSGQGLLHAIATAGDLIHGRREVKSQVIVLTDLRASAFAPRNGRDLERLARTRAGLGDKLEIVLIDLAGAATENISLSEARVRGGRVKVGDDAHVLAHVQNGGTKEKAVKLQLAVGNQPDPAIREVALKPGEEAVVDLPTPVNRSVRTIAQVRLKEDDALLSDNSFSVPLNVSETRRVLIVNGASQVVTTGSALASLGQPATPAAAAMDDAEGKVDGATILRYVLNPGRELGHAHGTGIDTTVVAPDALINQTLSKYELVVLYDVTSLPAQAMDDLNTYVRQGRSLLLVGSGGVNALQFNRLFYSGDAQRPGLSPAQLGNDKEFTPALALAESGSPHPWLAPFRDKLQGDLAIVRFTKVRELPALAPAASVMLAGAEGQPLAVEMPLERGRVALLGFGFELDRGNLARTRIFPTLMWRLVDYLTGQLRVQPPDVLTALQSSALDVSEPGFAFATELELSTTGFDAAPLRLPIGVDQTVIIPGLAAGEYQLHKPRTTGAVSGYLRNLTVHADPSESEMPKATEPQLADWLGGPVRVANLEDATKLAPIGGELWKVFVILLVAAYLAEAVIGYLLNARREKLRALEAAV